MKSANCLRLRMIRPVFEELVISEEAAKNFTGKSIRNSRDIYELFSYLSRESKEHFIAIHLDTKNRIICIDTVSIGSLMSSVVHPREVFKSVLLSSAASIAFIHNHPSGTPDPSTDDINITKRIAKETCERLEIGRPKGKTMLSGCIAITVHDEDKKIAYYGIRIKDRKRVFHKTFNPECISSSTTRLI